MSGNLGSVRKTGESSDEASSEMQEGSRPWSDERSWVGHLQATENVRVRWLDFEDPQKPRFGEGAGPALEEYSLVEQVFVRSR